MSFWADLTDPGFPFLRWALLLGVVVAAPLGIVGATVVARRISYLAAAVAHASLGGIGLALFLQVSWGWAWLPPLAGGLVAAVVAALLVGWLSRHGHEREDALIGMVWATGMALGLLLLAEMPAYVDPMSYLFGDLLLLSASDLWLAVGLAAVIVVLGIRAYPHIEAICFDAEYARLRGIRVRKVENLILLLTALTVILLTTLMGLVLVVALFTLPASIASRWARSLGGMMWGTGLVCAGLNLAGISLSYVLDWPSGPTVILLGAFAYALAMKIKVV